MPEKTKDGQPQIQRAVYTTDEAAAALGVTHDTIYRLIARGQIRTLPGIRHKRILRSELERYAGGPVVVPTLQTA